MLEYTTNRSIARDTFSDYCRYQWNDTITLYFNITYGTRCDCLSTFPADSDIAGLGVMVSYSAISLITTLVAVIPAFFDTTTDQRAKLRRLTNPKQPTTSPENHVRPEQMPALLCFAQALLGSLCDIQSFTSIAIVVSGLVQWPDLPFYHAQFVEQYWFLTLNSFFAARRESELGRRRSKDYRPKKSSNLYLSRIAAFWNSTFLGEETFQSWFRRLIVLCSTALFIVFYAVMIKRVYEDWDAVVPGYCFNSNDMSARGSEWFWLGGLVVFALTTLFTLFSQSNKVLSKWSERAESLVDSWFVFSIHELSSLRREALAPPGRQTQHGWTRDSISLIAKLIVTHALSMALLLGAFILWIIIQFLSVWSFGDGVYALEVAFYFAMWAWGVYDIVDLKRSNKHLLETSETEWGFGQVLPVVLIGIVGFNFIAAYKESKSARQRRPCRTQQLEPRAP